LDVQHRTSASDARPGIAPALHVTMALPPLRWQLAAVVLHAHRLDVEGQAVEHAACHEGRRRPSRCAWLAGHPDVAGLCPECVRLTGTDFTIERGHLWDARGLRDRPVCGQRAGAGSRFRWPCGACLVVAEVIARWRRPALPELPTVHELVRAALAEEVEAA
jgi:hypothetical protein